MTITKNMKLVYFVFSFEVPVINHKASSIWPLSPFFFCTLGPSLNKSCRKSYIATLIFFMYTSLYVSFVDDFVRSLRGCIDKTNTLNK